MSARRTINLHCLRVQAAVDVASQPKGDVDMHVMSMSMEYSDCCQRPSSSTNSPMWRSVSLTCCWVADGAVEALARALMRLTSLLFVDWREREHQLRLTLEARSMASLDLNLPGTRGTPLPPPSSRYPPLPPPPSHTSPRRSSSCAGLLRGRRRRRDERACGGGQEGIRQAQFLAEASFFQQCPSSLSLGL
jgi:hypothetical protein